MNKYIITATLVNKHELTRETENKRLALHLLKLLTNNSKVIKVRLVRVTNKPSQAADDTTS